MPTPIDPKRLPRLKAARKRVKDGEQLPQQELAKIYGVTNARFTTLAHDRFEGMPAPERRGDKTHWYDAAKALDAMIAYCQGQSKRKAAAAVRVARILDDVQAEVPSNSKGRRAKSAPDDDPEPEYMPTPADLDRIAKAELTTFRLEREKGEFVPVYQVRHTVRGIFSIVQRSFSSLAPEIDPHGELPPLQRARLESALKEAQLKLHEGVREFLAADAA